MGGHGEGADVGISGEGCEVMRKISKMYQWSGGITPFHTCRECRNCRKVGKGNKSVYKCMIYGNTNSEASDWRISWTACKAFNTVYSGRTVIRTVSRECEDEQLEGQMSLADIPGIIP